MSIRVFVQHVRAVCALDFSVDGKTEANRKPKVKEAIQDFNSRL